MKRLANIVACAALPLVLAAADAGDDPAPAEQTPDAGFAPYQTILDRMPFGEPPPGFDPEAAPGTGAGGRGGAAGGAEEELRSEEEQRLAGTVRVSVLNVTPDGKVAVGFTDSSAQPPANYYLKVGESRDKWTVRDADPAEQTVTLAKGDIEVELKVGEGSDGGKAGKKTAKPARAVPPVMGMGARAAAAPKGGSAMERLRARRMMSAERLQEEENRREEAAAEAKRDAEEAARQREEQKRQLQEIQDELRRQREEREAREAEEAAARQREAAERRRKGATDETDDGDGDDENDA